jgi:uncharacterized membrane protein YbhN (UPF0104 family)
VTSTSGGRPQPGSPAPTGQSTQAPDPSTPGAASDVDHAPDDTAKQRGRLARIVRNKRFVKLVAAIIMIGLLYYAFFVVLPSEIDWDEVTAALSALSATQVVLLGLSGVVVMVLLGWASKASLPGLTMYQGFESSGTSQMTAFVVPPPGDYVIRFSMYRTYGFTDEQSGVSVLIAMVLRYVAVFLMPVLGYGIALVGGVAPPDGLAWFLGLTAAWVAVVVLLRQVVRSDAAAHAVGRGISSVVTTVMRWFHRTPAKDLEASVVDFGVKTRGTIEENRLSLAASNIAWGLSNALVLGLAIRFTGLDSSTISLAAIFLATGALMVVNILPIPGKNALVAPALFTMLGLTTTADQSDLTAALVLYRVVTWIEPMLLGIVLFFLWRARVRRDTVTTVNDAFAGDAATPPSGDGHAQADGPKPSA